MFNKLFGLLVISLACFNMPTHAKTKYGITVDICQFDYDEEDFCSDKKMKKFAQIMKTRQPNFVSNKILYIYQTSNSVLSLRDSSYRMVVIDKKKKTVRPFYWAFNPAEVAVNNKGEYLEFKFNKTEPKFCVKGDIEAYRNTYQYDPKYFPEFCFPYLGDNNNEILDYAGFGSFER